MPLGRVVHAQIVADRPDDDLAGVEADPHREVEAMAALQLLGVAPQLVSQVKRRPARALGVILVRDRRPEQRHDAVAGVLRDGSLEAVHAVGEEVEEAVHDAVPVLGVELLGELHLALHVGEQDRDLLAFALEGGPRVQDLVGEVLRRPRGRFRSSTFESRIADVLEGGAAFAAEALAGFVRRAAGRAGHGQRRTATGAELSPFPILPSAGRAGHGVDSWRHLGAAPRISSATSAFADPVSCVPRGNVTRRGLGPARPPQRLTGSLVAAAPEGRPVRDYGPMLPPHGAFVMVSSTGAPASFLNDTSVVPAVASTSTRA